MDEHIVIIIIHLLVNIVSHIFANQGLRSSTRTFSSLLVYLAAKWKACAKRIDWMQPELHVGAPTTTHMQGKHL